MGTGGVCGAAPAGGVRGTEAAPAGAALRHFGEVNEMVRSTKHRKPFCRGQQIAGK